jgi:hypothetical protein
LCLFAARKLADHAFRGEADRGQVDDCGLSIEGGPRSHSDREVIRDG